ncbi:MAG: N-acetylmuramoyl-L-alanine amidase, partial [Solimonas sp.]
VEGHNRDSIGICMVGGVAADGKTATANFTPHQYGSLAALLYGLHSRYPRAEILGHRDLSPDKNGDGRITPNEYLKQCPSFDVRAWVKSANIIEALK